MIAKKHSSSCIDFDRIVTRNNGDFEAAFEELGTFIESLQSDMSKLQRLAGRDDSLAIASVAYRLRAIAKELGVELLYRNAARVEQAARKHDKSQIEAEIDLMQYQVDMLSQSTRLSFASDLFASSEPAPSSGSNVVTDLPPIPAIA